MSIEIRFFYTEQVENLYWAGRKFNFISNVVMKFTLSNILFG